MTKTEATDLFRVVRGACHHSAATAAISTPDVTDTGRPVEDAESAATLAQAHPRRACYALRERPGHRRERRARCSRRNVDAPRRGRPQGRSELRESLRSALNEHLQRADLHYAADRSYVESPGLLNGSDAETWRLLNAIKAIANAHFASALAEVPA